MPDTTQLQQVGGCTTLGTARRTKSRICLRVGQAIKFSLSPPAHFSLPRRGAGAPSEIVTDLLYQPVHDSA